MIRVSRCSLFSAAWRGPRPSCLLYAPTGDRHVKVAVRNPMKSDIVRFASLGATERTRRVTK